MKIPQAKSSLVKLSNGKRQDGYAAFPECNEFPGFVRGVAANGCINETRLGCHDQELCLYLKDTKG